MKYYTVQLGAMIKEDGVRTRKFFEVLGIVAVPNFYTSWFIHSGGNYEDTYSWCAKITKPEYESYTAFDFPVYKYDEVNVHHDERGRPEADVYVIYDPRYWEMVNDEVRGKSLRKLDDTK